MHLGATLRAKRALWKLQRGTLHKKFAKKWGQAHAPGSPVPTSMTATIIIVTVYFS